MKNKENWINLSDQLPAKGKDIKVKTSKGKVHYAFRCHCQNEDCLDWRDQITGYLLDIGEVIEWTDCE